LNDAIRVVCGGERSSDVGGERYGMKMI